MTQYTHEQTQTKKCSKCGEAKPLDEFHRNRKMPDGLQYVCKTCRAEERRAYYAANREYQDEVNRTWRIANPEKVEQYYARERAKYPERVAARSEVNKAVKRGDFPPPSALVCDHCQEAQAEQWHHYLGYAPEHWLDVIAVCIPCHVELDRRRL